MAKKSQKYVSRASEVHYYYDRMWVVEAFMRAIERVAEEVLKGLQDQVLPEYLPYRPLSQAQFEKIRFDYIEQKPILEHLRPAITKWAKEFHLSGQDDGPPPPEWGSLTLVRRMEPYILETLMEWGQDPDKVQLRWVIQSELSARAYMDVPAHFCFTIDGWSPTTETLVRFKERVQSKLETQLKNYVDNVERAFDREAYPAVPNRICEYHFEWLVLFKVNNKSYTEIAKLYNCSRTQISDMVKHMAYLLIGEHYPDWLMPVHRPGRPKSS